MPRNDALDDDLLSWFVQWTEQHPDATRDPWDWVSVRDAAGQDVPRRFLPDNEALVDGWWVKRFNRLAEHLGVRRHDLRSARQTAVAEEDEDEPAAVGLNYVQADFNVFFDWSVGLMRRAGADIARVDARVDEYCTAHPELALEPIEVKAQLRRAAGIA